MIENSDATSSTSVPGPSRSRRRYMPGSARSKTIELGTLSEVEEDLYQNRKDITNHCPSPLSQDDSCIGSVRRPSMGSVRSIARHLSEKHKAEKNAQLERQKEFESANQSFVSNSLSGPSKHNMIETNDRTVPPMAAQRRNTIALTASQIRQIEEIDNRHFAQEVTVAAAVQRSASERREMREPFNKWSPTHSEEKWSIPHNGSEYQRQRPPSVISRHPTIIGSCQDGNGRISRSASMVGRMLVYDPRTMSLIDPRIQTDSRIDPRFGEMALPIWLPSPSGHPVYIPVGAASSDIPYTTQKLYRRKEKTSVCCEVCCGGIAQLLWTIICIILMGLVSTLVLALFYI